MGQEAQVALELTFKLLVVFGWKSGAARTE